MSRANYISSLYLDQLEGASFLYGQRHTLFQNQEVCWKNIGKFEDRLEAQIDALVVGGDEALEVCRKQAGEGDAGELHVALRVFCRQGRKDLLVDVLEGLDPADKEKQRAFIDTMKYELPEAWRENFLSLLEPDEPQLCSMIAAVAGYRRLPAGNLLVQALRNNPSAQVIWAIGRLRERGAENLLKQCLQHDDEDICAAAALALLRIGDLGAQTHCLNIAGKTNWSHIPLALGGGRSTALVLSDVARTDKATQDTLIALGILGDSEVVELLLEKLNGDLAGSSALALNLITCAELYERVFIPEEVVEDELFPEELEAYRREGKVPTKPDGTPYGEWVSRLSQNPETWNGWWDVNRQRFTAGIRYRNGKLFSPACLLENLQHEKTPHRIRQLAYEELVIRYDVDFPFEADLFVKDQERILGDMANWVAANAGRFKDGEWYFAGQIANAA